MKVEEARQGRRVRGGEKKDDKKRENRTKMEGYKERKGGRERESWKRRIRKKERESEERK